MNVYMELQITNITLAVKSMIPALKSAALKNDGSIDPEEEKVIKQVAKANERYLRALQKIRDKY